MANQSLNEVCRDLIYANHILHYHNVVDAFGHVSVRHPDNPEIYLMCGYMPPALVRNQNDLIQYWVKDSSTVDPNSEKGYSERFIHGEVFRRFPEVNCVVHSHAEEVLPYVTTGIPLQPLYHMAGFLSETVPVFDIDPLYKEGDQRDMLVNNQYFGSDLASKFADSGKATKPKESVVLMRRHGFTAVGASIMQTVYRGIYTKINAQLQTRSMSMNDNWEAKGGASKVTRAFEYGPLTDGQLIGCSVMASKFQDKPWRLWVHEVQSSNIYTNELA